MESRCLSERPLLEPLPGEAQRVACWFPLDAPVESPVRVEH